MGKLRSRHSRHFKKKQHTRHFKKKQHTRHYRKKQHTKRRVGRKLHKTRRKHRKRSRRITGGSPNPKFTFIFPKIIKKVGENITNKLESKKELSNEEYYLLDLYKRWKENRDAALAIEAARAGRRRAAGGGNTTVLHDDPAEEELLKKLKKLKKSQKSIYDKLEKISVEKKYEVYFMNANNQLDECEQSTRGC